MHKLKTAVVLLLAIPMLASAQRDDTLRVGDRVRVKSGTTSSANVTIGTLKRIVPDTLELAMAGGRGNVTLARVAIAEVAISRGTESYRPNLLHLLTLAPIVAISIPLFINGHHSTESRVIGVGLILGAVPVAVARLKTQERERWDPVSSWLDRP